MTVTGAVLLALVLLGPASLAAQGVPVRAQPYLRYSTTDSLGRTVTFYVSEAGDRAWPLLLYVQGSGATSHFIHRDGRIAPRNGHASVRDAAAGRARLLIVEKPGVEFLGGAESDGFDPGAFHHEHTLERWVTALRAALDAARRLPGVDTTRLLVAGHSEGGLVAARLAATVPAITHVALLAGGGPSQLFDIVQLARRGEFFRDVSDDPEARARYVLDTWERIRANPDSDSLWFGHAYRRWASFLASSPMQELPHTRAAIYIAQGTADRAVTVESFNQLRIFLLNRNIPVTARLVEGANHSFARPEVEDGWLDQWQDVIAWWLGTER